MARNQMPIATRYAILTLREEGYSYREIAAKVDKPCLPTTNQVLCRIRRQTVPRNRFG